MYNIHLSVTTFCVMGGGGVFNIDSVFLNLPAVFLICFTARTAPVFFSFASKTTPYRPVSDGGKIRDWTQREWTTKQNQYIS